MRVAESIILDALTRGGCIKTFYRISSRQAAESATRIPEGYILESPGEREDIVLSRADFHALEKLLEQISFNAPELTEKTITVDEAYVDKQLADIVINRDLTQFIL